MGNRISIQFQNENEKSVVLFSHWGGTDFADDAKNYVAELVEEVGDKEMNPLDRLEPGIVMVDFIRHITKNETRVESDLYLGVSENDGDNSDNGHHIIDLIK